MDWNKNELDDSSMLSLTSTQNNTFIKESRITRKDKIDKKQEFHRKHPKSIAYYQNLEKSNTIIINGENTFILEQNMDDLEALQSVEKLENITSTTPEKTHKVFRKHSHRRNKSTNNTTSKNVDSTPGLSIKTKNNLQLMFHNLVKHYKKEGIFLDNKNGYHDISVMKDYNLTTTIGETKTTLTLRAIVGKYPNLKDIVIQHGTHFAPLKKDFQTWWNTTSNNYHPHDELNKKLSSVFNFYNQDERIKKFIPKLEEKLILTLKKPTKQPHGFIDKIEQIDMHWAEEAQEIMHIEEIENQLKFSSYEESFPLARTMKRKFSIFVGPTNSGKTYSALNELSKSRTGAYLGPLRLMAHEGRESLFERGIIANLITGEERIEIPSATHVSSTVEMCNMNKMVDVAVIDEIQMISDNSRGWAWSQALVGVPAKHVVLVGSEEALPFILPVLKSLGEEYEIKRFERKTPLKTHEALWRLKDLREGDCVVAFSRKSALEMKNAIEATGKRCSVIYGNLSPEVRRSEANKFKSGENPVLVATDAIGMGLNLPINRLFFSTLEKYDGITTRLLNISEIKQIAGRAGRYGFANYGEVGLLFEDNQHLHNLLHKAIYSGYDTAADTRIPIAPNLKQIQTICNTLGKQDLYSALIFFKEKMIREHDLYKTANLETMIEIASLIKNKNLSLATGLNYSCVPIDTGSDTHLKSFFKWMNAHMQNKHNMAPELPDVISYRKNDSYSLYEAENYVKLCMAYRWLHYKYPDNYPEIDVVTERAKLTNHFIEQALHKHIVISKNPRWKR